MPGAPSEELPAFMERIEAHLARAEEGSLAAMFADAPCDAATVPAGQVPHWMFALGDTLAINLIRALVAIGSHPDAQAAARGAGAAEPGGYVEACLNEAMRLWPTTTMLSRVTLADTEWRGETVPAGAQILIVNSFGHRDPERVDYADRFAPEEWISGDAAANPAFNHFSRGPQGCPGSALALRAGAAVVAAILAAGELDAESPRLDPAKPLPHMLDFFGARVRIA